MTDGRLDTRLRSRSGLVPPVGEHAAAPARRSGAMLLAALLALTMAAMLAWLFWIAPRSDGAIAWGDPIVYRGWMAWTLPTALFFWGIAALILLMLVLAIRFPETPRLGVLRIETTRGDRLFITLLGSGFINLAWLGLVERAQWGAVVVCLLYAFAVFRWV